MKKIIVILLIICLMVGCSSQDTKMITVTGEPIENLKYDGQADEVVAKLSKIIKSDTIDKQYHPFNKSINYFSDSATQYQLFISFLPETKANFKDILLSYQSKNTTTDQDINNFLIASNDVFKTINIPSHIIKEINASLKEAKLDKNHEAEERTHEIAGEEIITKTNLLLQETYREDSHDYKLTYSVSYTIKNGIENSNLKYTIYIDNLTK